MIRNAIDVTYQWSEARGMPPCWRTPSRPPSGTGTWRHRWWWGTWSSGL